MSRKTRQNLGHDQPPPSVQVVHREFSGPLPPPIALKQYDDVLPGAAERILAMAESQHHHRQTLESGVIHANISAQRLGTILGFIVAMTAVGGGIYLVAIGQQATGLAAILTPLVALVGVFVYGKRKQQEDLNKKRSQG